MTWGIALVLAHCVVGIKAPVAGALLHGSCSLPSTVRIIVLGG